MRRQTLLVLLVASGTVWAQAPSSKPASSGSFLDTVKNALHLNSTPAPAKPQPAAQKPATPAPKPAAPANPAQATAAKTPTAPANVKNAAASVPPGTASTKPAGATVKPAVVVSGPAKSLTNEKPATVKEVKIGSPFKGMSKSQAKAAIKPEAKVEPKVEPAMIKQELPVTPVKPLMERDPFISPIMRTSASPLVGCETGKRCLMVDQITLRGVVRGPNGMIAVVENAARRAYFLRENDPVFNGTVVKITGDSIMFRETVKDKVGKESTREVVKRVNAPAV